GRPHIPPPHARPPPMTDPSSTPTDETQPHETAGWRPIDRTPDPVAPDSTPSGPSEPIAGPATYSPAPEPRTDWTRPSWAEREPTPEHWFESATPVGARPAVATIHRGAGPGTVIVAALAAAVLASGGTIAALTAGGAFDRAPVAATASQGTNSTTIKQPLTLDESSAIIDVAAKAGPSVVRIYTKGIDLNSATQQEQDGVGSGIIFDPNGWILTNRHVVASTTDLTVQLKDGTKYDAKI